MFENVIVGVDGSDGGHDAAAFAQSLGPAQITLVGAYPHDPVRMRGSVAGFEELQSEDTQRDLEVCRATTGVTTARLLAIGDNLPSRALQRAAEERHADLIVLGSAHRGPIGRALLGDVGRAVIHDAPCPVAVAPRLLDGDPPRRIAVGYDGSLEAAEALALAQGLAADLGAALTVATVWQDPPPPSIVSADTSASYPQLAATARAAARAHLDAALADLPPQTAGLLLHGTPGPALEEFADSQDLLVVGSRRVGTISRVTLGSTSDHIVHHAPCAVIVVPRPAASTGEDEACGKPRIAAGSGPR